MSRIKVTPHIAITNVAVNRCDKKYTAGPCEAHLIHNLGEYDVVYLDALINKKSDVIKEKEEEAMAQGYRPLKPCTFSIEARAAREFCGELLRDNDCTSTPPNHLFC